MEKRSYVKSVNYSGRFEQKVKIELTTDDITEIKLLLTKWRYGFLSPVDYYRVSSIYTHIYGEVFTKEIYVVDEINNYCKKLYELVK